MSHNGIIPCGEKKNVKTNKWMNERESKKERERQKSIMFFFYFIHRCLYLANFNSNPPQYTNSILIDRILRLRIFVIHGSFGWNLSCLRTRERIRAIIWQQNTSISLFFFLASIIQNWNRKCEEKKKSLHQIRIATRTFEMVNIECRQLILNHNLKMEKLLSNMIICYLSLFHLFHTFRHVRLLISAEISFCSMITNSKYYSGMI